MRAKIKVVGVRMPVAEWRRLQREAREEGLPDAGALIRERSGVVQPGDPNWPSQARKRVMESPEEVEGGEDDSTG